MSENDKPLSQVEAKLVADYLKSISKTPSTGWVSLWKLSPSQIANLYKVSAAEVIKAARRA